MIVCCTSASSWYGSFCCKIGWTEMLLNRTELFWHKLASLQYLFHRFVEHATWQQVSVYLFVCCRLTYWMKTSDLSVRLTIISSRKMAHDSRSVQLLHAVIIMLYCLVNICSCWLMLWCPWLAIFLKIFSKFCRPILEILHLVEMLSIFWDLLKLFIDGLKTSIDHMLVSKKLHYFTTCIFWIR